MRSTYLNNKLYRSASYIVGNSLEYDEQSNWPDREVPNNLMCIAVRLNSEAKPLNVSFCSF
jgi:hypothetical protein